MPAAQRPPLLVIHAGAGPQPEDSQAHAHERRQSLRDALGRGRAVLQAGGHALAAARAAVAYMEDEADLFNAGRGSVLCSDATVEMSAAAMRGGDRAAGAVAAVRCTRLPVDAAVAVLEHSPHVLLIAGAADAFAATQGLEQCDPGYFVTERQRTRLDERAWDFVRGTVGAVCLDGDGQLAAATSTGGRRGQAPGRIGDTPLIGAGTWADAEVAVSCTGDGEEFIRAGAARQLALLRGSGALLADAAEHTLRDVASLGGRGGLIAIDVDRHVAMPFTSAIMNRGMWRAGEDPQVWI
jgi:L-asparaginase / beta-aspartyl-peptidase